MSISNIKIKPVSSGDWSRIAQLEAAAFGNDEFAEVAFGPLDRRLSGEYISHRAEEMRSSAAAKRSGEFAVDTKAIVTLEGGSELIVGYASWKMVLVSEGGIGVYAVADEHGGKGKDEERTDEQSYQTVLNTKLCDDLFIPGDRYMADVCGGRDYYKLYNLVIDPKYQRRGIGALLLEDGLRAADARNLQSVLGASPEGLGLYRKYGFVTCNEMSLNLWDYEGGSGKGVVGHCIMHRPATVNDKP